MLGFAWFTQNELYGVAVQVLNGGIEACAVIVAMARRAAWDAACI